MSLYQTFGFLFVHLVLIILSEWKQLHCCVERGRFYAQNFVWSMMMDASRCTDVHLHHNHIDTRRAIRFPPLLSTANTMILVYSHFTGTHFIKMRTILLSEIFWHAELGWWRLLVNSQVVYALCCWVDWRNNEPWCRLVWLPLETAERESPPLTTLAPANTICPSPHTLSVSHWETVSAQAFLGYIHALWFIVN